MPHASILVVDDEDLIRLSLTTRLKREGYCVLEAATGTQALERQADSVDLVFLDYRLPDMDGLAVLKALKKADHDLLVIMLTGVTSVDAAVETMRHGAYHFVNKPVNLDEIASLAATALETTRLRREVRALRATQAQPYGFNRVVGDSPEMSATRALFSRVAASPASTVLVTGESGTGKDLAARVIHYASDRAARAFVNITCSALPETLLESELFGHERGAFTGADRQKRGLFESADNGTVFLDEIGEMLPALQAKLLRFLEEKTFRRVGGSEDIHVNVRVIAATNRNLEEEVRSGRFREDLYYRLNVMPIVLPPLRQRPGDIPALANFFIDGFNTEFRKHVRGIAPDAAARLTAYSWPGNIRELRNAIERAMLLVDGHTLLLAHFPGLTNAAVKLTPGVTLPASGIDLDELERSLVLQALGRTDWNLTKAGALLGINRDQVRYRIEKFHIERDPTAASDEPSAPPAVGRSRQTGP